MRSDRRGDLLLGLFELQVLRGQDDEVGFRGVLRLAVAEVYFLAVHVQALLPVALQSLALGKHAEVSAPQILVDSGAEQAADGSCSQQHDVSDFHGYFLYGVCSSGRLSR